MGRLPPAWLVAALGAAIYLVADPHSADLAAQEYRVALFERSGFALWNNGWYAGHHTLGYSVLFPPLGALVGAQVVGALSAVAGAELFSRVAVARWGERARLGALWFAAGAAVLLLSGRMTFLLGLALGLGAILALQTGRRPAAAGLALASALASPVAGLFVALAAVAWGLLERDRWRWTGGLVVAALGPAVVISALFPEGGDEPFVASAFWPALGALGLVAAVLPRGERELRTGAGLYALGCVLAFAIDTPLGGNVTRLGALVAGPVVLCALAGRRRAALLAALAVPLAYWQLYPPIRDVVRISGDPSVHASYYRGLIGFLESRPAAGGFRVEVPFTENHWEAKHLALHVPLARGWERQLDRKENRLFYEDELGAARYEGWLRERAVRYVALPDADLDDSARDEAALIRRGTPFLRPVWRDAHWRVFAVRGRPAVLDGLDGTLRLTDDGFVLRALSPGTARLRIHASRWWRVTAGDACVDGGGPDDTLIVRVRRPGTIRGQVRLSGGGRC